MTIEQVRDRLASWYGGSEACLDVKACAELGDMIAALDAHLTQPAQAVDVGRVREAIGYLQSFRNTTPPNWDHTDYAASLLTRAISTPPTDGEG